MLYLAATLATIAITNTQQSHSAEPFVAAGPSGFAVVWEEQAPKGDRKRRIQAAVIDDAGKVVAGPKALIDGGALPNDLIAVWNGASYTVAVCNGSWGGKQKIVWGELAADAAFTKQGEKTFDASDEFFCRAATLSDGKVTIVVTTRSETFDDNDERTSRDCKMWRATIDGTKLSVSKPAKLCWSEATDDKWIAGKDPKDRLVFVDGKGKATIGKLAALSSDARIVRGAAGFLAVAMAKQGMELLSLQAPFKKPAKTTALEKGPFNIIQVTSIFALPGDGIGLVAPTPKGLEVALYKADGKLGWSGNLAPKVQYNRCVAGAKRVLCTWTDSDREFKGEVRAALLSMP